MRKHFPFMLHRTLAEVDETERLRRWRGRNVHVVSKNWWGAARLRELEARAVEPGALLTQRLSDRDNHGERGPLRE